MIETAQKIKEMISSGMPRREMLRAISSVVRQVPILPPRIIPRVRPYDSSPALTRPIVITVIAVLLCSTPVISVLDTNPVKGVRVEA
ncbi:hypothetical protein D3C77_412480 [compost metagenome]